MWSFLKFANKWINVRFGIDDVMTGNLISITFFFQLALIPIMGIVGDKFGNRTT